MNRLNKFRHTPSGRTKMDSVEDIKVSTSANTRDSGDRWAFISVSASKDWASYYIHMDRETAARVARQIQDYLDSTVPS
jgi:hypothetical protein